MIKFVSHLWQVNGYFLVRQDITKILLKVALNTIKSNYIYILLNCTVFISLGNSLRYNNGVPFSTKDNDNDQTSGYKCADHRHGAWWFIDCGNSSLNGKYLNKSAADSTFVGITWYNWKGNWNSLKKTYMMIRRL